MEEQGIDGGAGQADARDQARQQEVAGHPPRVAVHDLATGGVTDGQRKQEETDRRRGDDDGAAHMGNKAAQGHDFSAQGAEAFDEDDQVDQHG